MNPNSIVIPALGIGNTSEEIQANVDEIVIQLESIYPFLAALAQTFQEADESSKQGALDSFLALDAKRREIDDVLAAQLNRLRNME